MITRPRDAGSLPAAYGRATRGQKEEGVVRWTFYSSVAVVAGVALAFVAVALTLALNG
jgi:hypothetical protein